MAYSIFNGDGTRFNPPEIDSYKKLIQNRFPPCSAEGYQCMYCSKCPKGDYFKWPDDCKETVEAQKLAVRYYVNAHNTLGFNSIYLSLNESENG